MKRDQYSTMWKSPMILLATWLLLTLMLLFWQPTQAQTEEHLVVLMPTPSTYTGPYIERFAEWYFQQTGKTIVVEHVRKGGVECVEHITGQAGQPYEDVIASIGYKEIKALRMGGYLDPYASPNAASIPNVVLKSLVGKDLAGYYTGVSLSGYGIMVNTDALHNESLTMPTGYFDLSHDTRYGDRIVMGSPVMSRIAHGNIEVILSHFGWVEGWNTIIHLASLVDMFMATTGIANNLTAKGDYAVTLTKYSYWYEYASKGYPVEWIWPVEGTYIYVLYTGVLHGAKNQENARLWVDWMLSEEGQRAWAEIRYETVLRSDIILPAGMPSVDELGVEAKIEPNYSEEILAKRYAAVDAICLKMIGYHPNLKKKNNSPEALHVYIEKWVEEPMSAAEEEISLAQEVIGQSRNMALTEKGQYFLARAETVLAQAQYADTISYDYEIAHSRAKEAHDTAKISMAYPVQPLPPPLWPYYLVIAAVVSLALAGLAVHRTQVQRHARKLEIEVEKKTRAITEGEKRYRMLVENAPLGIFAVDTSGQIKTVNPALLEILGAPSAEATIAINMLEFPPLVEAGVSTLFRRCIESGETITTELPYRSKWGKDNYVRLHLNSVRDDEGEVVGAQALVEDITERKRAEEDLKRAYHELNTTQAQLVQSGKLASIGELAAGVAHELNQPLMVIRTSAQFIRRTLEKGKMETEQLLTLFEPVERNTKRMMNIINHLRTFSRQSQGEFSPQQINMIIENSFLMVGEQLRLHNIAVTKNLAPHLPTIRGDANQLEQVFLNLLTNARDAIEAKGGKEPGRIDIVTCVSSDDNTGVEILVKDTGTGIAADHLEKMFDPFFTSKEVGKGTGLGLSISYGIIQDHQGEIEVTATGPEGSTFRIQLPILIDEC